MRPSNRAKFQDNNRDTIHSDKQKTDRAVFKQFSKSQVRTTIGRIREQAKANRRKEHLLIISVGVVVVGLLAYGLYPSKVEVPIRITPPAREVILPINVEVMGDRVKPLSIANTSFMYSLLIKGYHDSTLLYNYEIRPPNMVGRDVQNIRFLGKDTVEIGLLLQQDGSITIMWGNMEDLGEKEKNEGIARLIYLIAKEDTNGNGEIDPDDLHMLYMSNPDGSNLQCITERAIKYLDWSNSGRSLLIQYYPLSETNDTIYGCYDVETSLLHNSTESSFIY